MILHSTNGISPKVTLTEGIVNGIAPDGGLYMPDELPRLPQAVFRNMADMSLKEIAYVISNSLFGNVIASADIKRIVDEALNFDIPLRRLSGNRFVLELFHGPTLSFKDVGARFMARLQAVCFKGCKPRDILLATSGDSGGAVANAYIDVPGITVNVVFPKDGLSRVQVSQFATLPNVRAIEVEGNFDDCQQMVKEALRQDASTDNPTLTSGNSINLARELPSLIYFFHAYARAVAVCGSNNKIVIAIPCGNLGSFCAAMMAKKMGLPVDRFIAANNANDAFVEYLKTGGFKPHKALITIARAMDVGNPSNIARIIDLYGGNLAELRKDVEGYAYSNDEIAATMKETYDKYSYLIDPQGATALRAINRHLKPDEIGVALASAHPAKFRETVSAVTGMNIIMPESLDYFMARPLKILRIPATLGALRRALDSGESQL